MPLAKFKLVFFVFLLKCCLHSKKLATYYKVFEHIIAERLEVYLWTNDNQFGFKSGHSTDLCIYALSEFIEYF